VPGRARSSSDSSTEERSSDRGRGGLGIGDAHVVKPIDPAQLIDVIASVLLRRREQPRSETAGAGDLPVKDGRPLLGEGA
jgi:DNA-binding response OmpR family regulator